MVPEPIWLTVPDPLMRLETTRLVLVRSNASVALSVTFPVPSVPVVPCFRVECAGADGGHAGVGIPAAEDQGPRAGCRQRLRPADHPPQRELTGVLLEGQARAQRDRIVE